jgi:hypothetical protein
VTGKLTKEIIDRIFREPGIKYELTDFESLGKPIHEIITIYPNEYLALAISSRSCRMQIDRECSGALILHWKPVSIRKLRIPILAEAVMYKIATLVTEAKLARRKSNDLLDQAKARVEQLIEEAVKS